MQQQADRQPYELSLQKVGGAIQSKEYSVYTDPFGIVYIDL